MRQETQIFPRENKQILSVFDYILYNICWMGAICICYFKKVFDAQSTCGKMPGQRERIIV
jgi:hypothetical protein